LAQEEIILQTGQTWYDLGLMIKPDLRKSQEIEGIYLRLETKLRQTEFIPNLKKCSKNTSSSHLLIISAA